MIRSRKKINIFFTASYVIIMGLAIPNAISNSRLSKTQSTAVNTSSQNSSSCKNTSSRTVKVVSLSAKDIERNKSSNPKLVSDVDSITDKKSCFTHFIQEKILSSRLSKPESIIYKQTVVLIS